MAPAGRQSFVGRAAVLDELTELLDQAAAGAGSALLLYGEAGIGKTRTLEELAAVAADRGFLVAWGRCTELDGVPPLWSWRDVFTAFGLASRAMPPGRAAVLAALVDRIDLLGAERPLLICVEDVHWADADTRWLLRGLADATAGRALAVVASWRVAEAADELLDLPPRVRRLPLAALSEVDSRTLAEQLADGRLPEHTLSRAVRQAGGNPFFIGELVRMHLLGPPGAERVPRGVWEVLARRLARLPSPTVELLSLAAVLGGDAEPAVLAAAADRPPRELLEPAVRAGLIAPVVSGPVAFAHAVVREVLLAEAGPERRTALHERAASGLEVCRPDADEALARHWAEVPGADAAGRALRHARSARDAARAAGALEQAVLFATLAAERTDDPEDLLVLGDARARVGDMGQARDDLVRAGAAARRQGRPDLLARAALALAGGEGGFEVALDDDLQIALLAEAADALPPGGLRARVRARQAVATSLSAPLAERIAIARAAVAEAEADGDDGALLHALAAYADMIGAPRFVAERRAVADRMLSLARAQADVGGELLARRFRLVAFLEVGEFAAADNEIAAFERLAHRTREPAHQWYPPLWRGMQALLAGREAEAEALADQVAAIGGRAQSVNAHILAMTLRLAARTGRPDALAELLDDAERYGDRFRSDVPQVQALQAWIGAAVLDAGRTEASFRPLADAGFATLPEDAEYFSSLLGCVEAALFLRDVGGARRLIELLRPYEAAWIVDGIGAACWGVVGEWLSRLAELVGDPGNADRWRRQAEDAYRAADARGPLRRVTQHQRPPEKQAELRREPGGWVVSWNGRQAAVPTLKGLHDLAVLVARPGTPVPAVALLAAAAGVDLPLTGGGDEVLDERARTAYRDRLRALEDELAEADAATDLGRAERLRDERDFLLRELSAALGLGGRPRRLGDDVDRARKAVTMRLRDAIARFEEPLPELAAHLRSAVHTGRECCYAPDEPVSWYVRTGSAAG
jgi:hypothetical protein